MVGQRGGPDVPWGKCRELVGIPKPPIPRWRFSPDPVQIGPQLLLSEESLAFGV